MTDQLPDIAFIGLGEAGMAFARMMVGGRIGYDRRDDAAKRADFAGCGVARAASNATAVTGVALILSLVTADQALAAARDTAGSIAPGALFCDMNSVAPDTKRAARDVIERAGGRYVDVAVMAPVHPALLSVPLLASGPHADTAAAALAALGFAPRAIGGAVGEASAIKMIRSVMITGIEALSAECVLAAEAAGVRDAVIASLDASWPGADWARRFDYNLDRMMIHGVRRAAEMDEVVATLDALGTGSAMARAVAVRQRVIGALGLVPPGALQDKLALLRPPGATQATVQRNEAKVA